MKTCKFHYYLLFVLFLIEVNSVKAQITGVVTDAATGKGMPGVTVFLPERTMGTSTDEGGKFRFEQVNSEKVLLQFSMVGYNTETVTYNRESEERLEVKMTPGVYQIDGIVVMGGLFTESKKTPYQTAKVSADQIENRGNVSLMDAVAEEPGVDMISLGPGISKPILRGLSFSRVMTVYNGLRFENQQWGADHGIWASNTGVAGVEIIKGPASILYGSGALGGVVNILEETPEARGESRSYFKSDYHSNSYGFKNELGTRGTSENGIFYSFAGAYESHADFKDGDYRTIGNSRFNNRVFKGDVGIQKKFGTMKLSFHEIDQNLGIIEDTELEETLATHSTDREMQLPFMEVNDRFLSLQSTFFTGKNSSLIFNANYHRHLRKEIEDEFDEVDLGLLLETFNYDLKYKFNLFKNVRLTTGVQGFYQENNNLTEAEEILVPNADIFDAGAYALAAFDLKKLNILTGGRFDYRTVNATTPDADEFPMPGPAGTLSAESEFSGWTASLGATYQLSNKFLLKANTAKGFRAPDLAELYSNGRHPGTQRFERGNPNFNREENYEADLSLEFSSKSFRAAVAGYANYIDNYIYFRPAGEMVDGLNLWSFDQNDAFLRGVEGSVEWTPIDRLKLYHNLSYTRAEDRETGNALPLIPPFKTLSRVKYLYSHYEFAVTHRFAANQNRIAPDEEITPAYNLFDASVHYLFDYGFTKGSLGISVQNVFNETYFDHSALTREFGVFNPGRNIRVRAAFNF